MKIVGTSYRYPKYNYIWKYLNKSKLICLFYIRKYNVYNSNYQIYYYNT